MEVVACWLNLLGSAGAWFDEFLDGCFQYQMRLLLPCSFFEFKLGVMLFGAVLFFCWSWRDLSFSRSSAMCALVHSDIRPVRAGWDTVGSFWMASAICWEVVR